ncbi:alpha/beta fold hydrolase [Tepidamorphus sp. 3E244]|uniref:alpha/beta fold hydrolase n=1 Tax=Tepidamorphus sp. 3E244 TaxID=3385498 RepID=UPI0038FBED1C
MSSAQVNLHVEDSGGTGRPVILIHGWPLSAKAWEYQVPALRDAGLRVIAYDRRGFGRSDKPASGFDYSTLAGDLLSIIEDKGLRDVSLVGFSMGGGEVARYVGDHGQDRIHSLVFASAVPPCMMRSDDNPDGPLTREAAEEMESGLKADRDAFFDQFTKDFFTANDALKVSESERQKTIELCKQSDQDAALGCMEAFGTTDFRDDLKKVVAHTLVLHGDSDGIVPIKGSGERTHAMIPNSKLLVLAGAPHGCNVSHPREFNTALVDFLRS